MYNNFNNILYNSSSKTNIAKSKTNIAKINQDKFNFKKKYNIVIPANIFQTWHTKKLPPLMYKTVEFIKKTNKGFKYFLFDDNDCIHFIKKHFNEDVLNAYNSLIPGAYKADLWRYCVLYIYGGIYLDIKYIPINGFKFIHLLEQEHFTLDINKQNIYNALLVCKPQNQILLNAINQIVANVKNKYYGKSPLEPTGPALLGNLITQEDKQNTKIYHTIIGNNDHDKIIKYQDKVILRCYPSYFIDRQKYSKTQYYSNLWHQRKIYK